MIVYNEWIKNAEAIDQQFKIDKKLVVSAQGFELMPDFPEVQIKVQEDQYEDPEEKHKDW